MLVRVVRGIGEAKSHFGGIFKSFKSIISDVIQPLGEVFRDMHHNVS